MTLSISLSEMDARRFLVVCFSATRAAVPDVTCCGMTGIHDLHSRAVNAAKSPIYVLSCRVMGCVAALPSRVTRRRHLWMPLTFLLVE